MGAEGDVAWTFIKPGHHNTGVALNPFPDVRTCECCLSVEVLLFFRTKAVELQMPWQHRALQKLWMPLSSSLYVTRRCLATKCKFKGMRSLILR